MFTFNCLPRVTFRGVAAVIGALAVIGVGLYLLSKASLAINNYGWTEANRVQLFVGTSLLVVVLLPLVKFLRKKACSSDYTVDKFLQDFTLTGLVAMIGTLVIIGVALYLLSTALILVNYYGWTKTECVMFTVGVLLLVVVALLLMKFIRKRARSPDYTVGKFLQDFILSGEPACLLGLVYLIMVRPFIIQSFYYISGVAAVIGTLAIIGVALYLLSTASIFLNDYGWANEECVKLIVGVLLLVVVVFLLVKFIRNRVCSSDYTVEKFLQDFVIIDVVAAIGSLAIIGVAIYLVLRASHAINYSGWDGAGAGHVQLIVGILLLVAVLPVLLLLEKFKRKSTYFSDLTVEKFLQELTIRDVVAVIGTLAIIGVALYLVSKASNATNYYGWTWTNILQMIVGVFLLVAVLLLLVKFLRKRTISSSSAVEKFLQDFTHEMPSRYSYSQLKKITNDFVEKLGEGGFGVVFKGKLTNGTLVAVKILDQSRQSESQFMNEVATIGRIHHVHLVRLMGYCFERFRSALIYEYMTNGSLDRFVFLKKEEPQILSEEQLYSIALGAARGIAYLHEECERRIIHFDIKPHNILLDADFTPKISDFGLSKLCGRLDDHVSVTAWRGTPGYAAPELLHRNLGPVTDKADVYSFGMLLMEIVGQRRNIDVKVSRPSEVYYPDWVFNLLEKGELQERLRGRKPEEIECENDMLMRMCKVGLWCIQYKSMERPTMSRVVQILEGNGDEVSNPPCPFNSSASRQPSLSSCPEESSSM